MNRIDKKFRDLKRKREKAFIAYITAGDPGLKATGRLAVEFGRCGVDILELGVPFSDPIADGPTIQAASQRALRNNIDAGKIFGLVKKIRNFTEMPIALMTYYNPVYAYGIAAFTREARACGVDGIIVPDLPPEEAGDLINYSRKYGLKHIFLLSPTSSDKRIRLVSRLSDGFIYYVSLTGVTGVRRSLPSGIKSHIDKIKRVTDKPVCVGFGISSPAQAKAVSRGADGVIIGSAIIKLVEKNSGKKDMPKAIGGFVKRLVRSVKGTPDKE